MLLILVSSAAGEQNSDNLSVPGTDSKRRQDLLQSKLPKQAYGTNPIVPQAPSGKLTDSKYKKPIDDTVSSLKKAPHVITVVSPLSSDGASALSKDKTIGYISVTLDEGPSDLTKEEAQDDHRRGRSRRRRRA